MTQFNEIIDFAISREKEAVQFYRDLQGRTRFDAQKKVLEDFEKMEQGHVTLLEGVKKRHSFIQKSPPAVDLKLDDYLVDVEPSDDMNYQDILILAIKREKHSMDLYSRMAAEAEDVEISTIFERLCTEETHHKDHFEKLYDQDILSEN